eukprot:gnl/Ergobibamus_cyprinoides/211.p3 GENE.gnl/Ergobibamus_cyprinoides/211~~gnl/Ergobibamus_cyprinoides/211.p3  ORF type:complete len:257 (+),score=60.60 gnl/Ergobibamus_cyprinoides/211:512-1282(+)
MALPAIRELRETFRRDISSLSADFLSAMRAQAAEKSKFVSFFQQAASISRDSADTDSRGVIQQHLAKRTRFAARLASPATTRAEASEIRGDLLADVELVGEALLDREALVGDQVGRMLSRLDADGSRMVATCVERIQAFFGAFRGLEAQFHEESSNAAATELEALSALSDAERRQAPAETRSLLKDRNTLTGLLTGGHDSRQTKIDTLEDSLTSLQKAWLRDLLALENDKERKRARDRVAEIGGILARLRSEGGDL